MLIAHLSDLHVFSLAPETSVGRLDIVPVVEAIVADLCALDPAPDAVVFTGDLADGGTEDDYRLVGRLLAPLPMPVIAVPGNHDRRGAMRTVLGAELGFEPGAFLNSRIGVGEATLIGLDTVIAGQPQGELCGARLDWLAAQLETAGPVTFIGMHHPPFPTGNSFWDRGNIVAGGERFRALIAGARSEVRVLCGHVHQTMHGVWAGRYCAIAGSPSFQYALAIGGDSEPPVVVEPYFYHLHHRRDDGSFGVHRCHVALPGNG